MATYNVKEHHSASVNDLLYIGFDSILDDVDRAICCAFDDLGSGIITAHEGWCCHVNE